MPAVQPQDLTLGQFTGTENWYRHALNRRVTFTDGARYVADKFGAYWLLDEIALNQARPQLTAEHFQVWELRVTGSTAELTVQDGNGRKLWKKPIPLTDFPEPGIDIWFVDGVILLPSEY